MCNKTGQYWTALDRRMRNHLGTVVRIGVSNMLLADCSCTPGAAKHRDTPLFYVFGLQPEAKYQCKGLMCIRNCMCYQSYLQALLQDWLKRMEMAPWRYRWIYFCLPHLPRIDFMFNNRRPQKSWRMWESRLPCSTMFATVSWKRRDSVAMFGEKYICHVLEGYSGESFQLAETSFIKLSY